MASHSHLVLVYHVFLIHIRHLFGSCAIDQIHHRFIRPNFAAPSCTSTLQTPSQVVKSVT